MRIILSVSFIIYILYYRGNYSRAKWHDCNVIISYQTSFYTFMVSLSVLYVIGVSDVLEM